MHFSISKCTQERIATAQAKTLLGVEPSILSRRVYDGQWLLMLVPLKGGIGSIFDPPIGRFEKTTYSPCLRLGGEKCYLPPTFYRNQKQPLNRCCLWSLRVLCVATRNPNESWLGVSTSTKDADARKVCWCSFVGGFNPIYTLYSGYLLGISVYPVLKGFGGLNS